MDSIQWCNCDPWNFYFHNPQFQKIHQDLTKLILGEIIYENIIRNINQTSTNMDWFKREKSYGNIVSKRQLMEEKNLSLPHLKGWYGFLRGLVDSIDWCNLTTESLYSANGTKRLYEHWWPSLPIEFMPNLSRTRAQFILNFGVTDFYCTREKLRACPLWSPKTFPCSAWIPQGGPLGLKIIVNKWHRVSPDSFVTSWASLENPHRNISISSMDFHRPICLPCCWSNHCIP